MSELTNVVVILNDKVLDDNPNNNKSNDNKPNVTVNTDVIHCANCLYAKEKMVPIDPADATNKKYQLFVRCLPNKWGMNKMIRLIPLSSIHRKVVRKCKWYNPMGDLHPYIEDLANELPIIGDVFERGK
jgi:hypothetical protein